MVLMTMIARIADGLPLAASMQEEEQRGRSLVEYQSQAKQLFKRMNYNSPNKGSLETGPYLFHYLMERGICYLVLCDQSFSKRLAFAFLDELQMEFTSKYGNQIEKVSRPYSFIEFDIQNLSVCLQAFQTSRSMMLNCYLCQGGHLALKNLLQSFGVSNILCRKVFLNSLTSGHWNNDTQIQKIKKSYMDSRSRHHLNHLNSELQDVQKIMVQNIDDVLQRGEALSALDDKASNLATLSQKYKKDAHYLNLKSSYVKIASIVVIIVIFLLFIRYFLF